MSDNVTKRQTRAAAARTEASIKELCEKNPKLTKVKVVLQRFKLKNNTGEKSEEKSSENPNKSSGSSENSNQTDNPNPNFESDKNNIFSSHENFDQLTDIEEKLEAYKELAEKLEIYIKDEREQHLIELEKSVEIILDLVEELEELENELNNQHTQLLNTKSIINQNMPVEIKDIISSIPMFSGKKEEIDGFINTCDVYMQLVEDGDMLLKIIKAKITGEALSKVSPLSSYNTWELLKNKIKSSLKKKVSLEYAQEDMNNTFQKRDESIEDYGTRIKKKLAKLNDAIKEISENETELRILRKMNEKSAISKFEQNIKNQTIKVLVSAASKETLDEAIIFAMQKELLENHKVTKRCTICNLTNHTEQFCRRANSKNNNNNINTKQTEFKKSVQSQNDEDTKSKYSNNHNASSSNTNSDTQKSNWSGKKYNQYNENKKFNAKTTHTLKTLESDFQSLSLNDESEMTVAEAIENTKNE